MNSTSSISLWPLLRNQIKFVLYKHDWTVRNGGKNKVLSCKQYIHNEQRIKKKGIVMTRNEKFNGLYKNQQLELVLIVRVKSLFGMNNWNFGTCVGIGFSDFLSAVVLKLCFLSQHLPEEEDKMSLWIQRRWNTKLVKIKSNQQSFHWCHQALHEALAKGPL